MSHFFLFFLQYLCMRVPFWLATHLWKKNFPTHAAYKRFVLRTAPLNHVPAQQEFSWHKGYVDGFLQLLRLRGTGDCRSAYISESILFHLASETECFLHIWHVWIIPLPTVPYLLLFHNKSGWEETLLPIHIFYSLVSNERVLVFPLS